MRQEGSDPKREPRRRDPALLKLLHFEFDSCVLCGTTHQLHLHHVVFRSQGGDDIRSNLVMFCLECHQGYHTSRSDGYGARLATYIQGYRPDTYAYLVEKLGVSGAEVWFEKHADG